MKTIFTFVLICLATSNVLANYTPCKKEVEKQNSGLAQESEATLELKSTIIKQIEQGETTLESEDAKELMALLKKEMTVAFSFSNDAGVWLSIANSKSCKVITTVQILEI